MRTHMYLDKDTIVRLNRIAKADYEGNRSLALRQIVLAEYEKLCRRKKPPGRAKKARSEPPTNAAVPPDEDILLEPVA